MTTIPTPTTPEEAYELCLRFAGYYSHDNQSREAIANGAAMLLLSKLAYNPKLSPLHARNLCAQVAQIEYNTRDNRYIHTDAELIAAYHEDEPNEPNLTLDWLTPASPHEVERIIEARETTETAKKLLALLPADVQRMMLARYYGASFAEIAEQEHTTEKMIRKHLGIARQILRKFNPDLSEQYQHYLNITRPKTRKKHRPAEDSVNWAIRTGKPLTRHALAAPKPPKPFLTPKDLY